jgi:hypothetical protein
MFDLKPPRHISTPPNSGAIADIPQPPLGAMCGRIWTPPDCNRSAELVSTVTTADVYPAFWSGWTTSSPRASMAFRPLPPQRPPDIGRGRAGPHIRFGKRRGDRLTISCLFAAIAEVGPPFPLRARQAAFIDSFGS